MRDTLSWLFMFAAAFFFGVATTVKLLTWILTRNNEFADGGACLGNLVFATALLLGIYLVYLSLSGT